MYEVFYNLTAEPFRLSPDHSFCYEHKGYARARAYMAYAFMRAEGFVMITGRPGTGKTTLIGELVASLAKDDVFTANLVCTQLQADDLLKTVAYNFGVGASGTDKAELLQRLSVLFHRWHRDGRRALLIVDEAQDLSLSAMEELRLLTNIQLDGQPLLQIFLLGQPELRELVLSPQLEQVHQRIVAASHLEGLEEDEVEPYVMHRLKTVGWRGEPAISRAIFPLLHKFSEGVPRRINLICSRLFLHGCVEQQHAIEVDDVRLVVSELQAENLAAGTRLTDQDFAVAGPEGWAEVPEAPEPPAPAEPAPVPAPAEPGPQALDEETEVPPRSAVRLRAVVASAEESSAAAHMPATGKVPAPAVEPDSLQELVTPLTQGYQDGAEARVIPLAEPESLPASAPESLREPAPEPVARPMLEEHAPRAEVAATAAQGRASAAAVAPRSGGSRKLAVALVFLLVLALAALGIYLPSVLLDQDDPWADISRLPPMEEFVPFKRPGDEVSAEASEAEPDMFEGEPVPPAFSSDAAFPVPRSVEPDAITDGQPESPGIGDELYDDERMVGEEDIPAIPEPGAAAEPLSTIGDTLDPGQELPATAGEPETVAPPEAQPVQVFAPAPATPPAGDLVLLVSFPFDSIELTDRAREVLDEAAGLLLRDASTTVTLTGYADSQGDGVYNMQLSRERAAAVGDYLSASGVSTRRIYSEGRGTARSGSTDTSEGSVGNETYRIVQIRISRGRS